MSILTGGLGDAENVILTGGLQSAAGTPPSSPPAPPAVYTVTVVDAANGSTSLEAGTYSYDAGTQLNITAVADDGYMFLYWTDGSGTNNYDSTYQLTVSANITLTPVYTQLTGPPGDYSNMPKLWTSLLQGIHAKGIDTTVTIHNMSLGEADDITGIPKQFWVDVPADMIINPSGIDYMQLASGNYTGLKARGFTYTRILDGDEVTDKFGNIWYVESAVPYVVGDVLQYYESKLSLTSALSSPSNNHPIAYQEFRFRVKVIDADTFENDHFPYTFPFMLS